MMLKHKIVIPALSVLLLSLVVILVVKCSVLNYSRRQAEMDLERARTADEEWAVFDRMARNTRMEFALFDGSGTQLGISTSDWTCSATLIRFYQFGEPPLEHRIIERKNIGTLMRE